VSLIKIWKFNQWNYLLWTQISIATHNPSKYFPRHKTHQFYATEIIDYITHSLEMPFLHDRLSAVNSNVVACLDADQLWHGRLTTKYKSLRLNTTWWHWCPITKPLQAAVTPMIRGSVLHFWVLARRQTKKLCNVQYGEHRTQSHIC